MIWAQANNRVIGKQGTIPWYVPEDLKFFKQRTEGCAIIMGRKTWESLPDSFRPLPNRQNIVITSDPTYSAWGAEVVLSPEAALKVVQPGKYTWVVGGRSIYDAFMDKATLIITTEVDVDVEEGDTFAPEIDKTKFFSCPPIYMVSAKGINYSFVVYLATLKEKSQEGLKENENKLPE